MSISIGTLKNETVNDNRLRFNSFFNSNVIILNTEDSSYKDAVINFKNQYNFGFSNNAVAINKDNFNIFNSTILKSHFSNDLYIKSNFNTSNDITFIHSNSIFKFYNSNNYISYINSNNQEILRVNNSNFQINFNNSNKLTIDSNGIFIKDNITLNSNNIIYANFIKSITPDVPVTIETVKFNHLIVDNYYARGSLNISNDTIYPIPTININRFSINCNIIDIYNRDFATSNTSNRIFSLNNNGFIGIGSNIANYPFDINLYTSNNLPIIFNYSNLVYNSNYNSNDYFKISNKGYISIGSSNNDIKNQIYLEINDDTRNIVNSPILNFNLNYNSNNNYRTSNPINLQFTAIRQDIPIFNNEDSNIGTSNYKFDNYVFKFNSNIISTSFSLNPPSINSKTINVSNSIYNDLITNTNISNIIPINSFNYLPFTFTNFDTTFFINYTINLPKFLNLDINEINIQGNRINPSLEVISGNYFVNYNNYIYKTGTVKPYYDSNFLLKEFEQNIFTAGNFSIFIKQRLYIELGTIEFKNFIDYINYIYQPPPNLIYATSNKFFSVSLSADGKLALGDIPPNNNYQLYINKKSQITNLECWNISSIPSKNNINFTNCNISNINKAFFTSNICSNIIAQNGFFNNISINNLNVSNLAVKDIFISNLRFDQINTSNLISNSNIFNPSTNVLIGSNNPFLNNTIANSYLLGINLSSNSNNGISVHSIFNNTNPSIAINAFGSNSFPSFSLNNSSASYHFNLNNNNFNFFNNDRIIYKHNSNQHLYVIGASNNIIFDLNPIPIPDNTTNKIAFGYPYRYLMQNGFNLKNWETDFSVNSLKTNAMFNVYGNVNLSSINNTPFINCIATSFPNEVINVCIGSNISRSGYIFNVEGNSYFSSNIYVESNVFVRGTIGNVSDIRVKDNLIKISNSIDKINKINGYIYTRKDTGNIETGLIAQEVLSILPEVVNLDNTTNYYNISYGNITGLLVEGIKELNNRLLSIENLLKNSCNYP
jgi:hypothetical protein